VLEKLTSGMLENLLAKNIYNKRGSYAPPEKLNENLHPICSMGYELSYWGKDGDYLKFRCPHAVSKVDCSQGQNWCSMGSAQLYYINRWYDCSKC